MSGYKDSSQAEVAKGPFINHVVKILGIFDPPPLFVVTFTK